MADRSDSGSGFDNLARALASTATRRQMLQVVAGAMAGGLASLLGKEKLVAQGNSDAAHWCHANFQGSAAGQCTSAAAQGGGPYYDCGSGGTNNGLCKGRCCSGCRSDLGCVSGTSDLVCGKGGVQCQRCPFPLTCINGVCVACSPQTCPDGCCSGRTQTCEHGGIGTFFNREQECGPLGGGICKHCEGATRCISGPAGPVCEPCNAQTCPNGCCSSDGFCFVNSINGCGSGGVACVNCTLDQICRSGQCVCVPEFCGVAGKVCQNNACTCPTGTAPCATLCCPSGQLCCNGFCCNPGETCVSSNGFTQCHCVSGPLCNGVCCPGGQTCVGNTCTQCARGVVCNRVCCGAGQTCTAGACVAACPACQVLSGSTCVPITCPQCHRCDPATGTCSIACNGGNSGCPNNCPNGDHTCCNGQCCGPNYYNQGGNACCSGTCVGPCDLCYHSTTPGTIACYSLQNGTCVDTCLPSGQVCNPVNCSPRTWGCCYGDNQEPPGGCTGNGPGQCCPGTDCQTSNNGGNCKASGFPGCP